MKEVGNKKGKIKGREENQGNLITSELEINKEY